MKAFWSVIWSGFRGRNRWRFGTDGINAYYLITNRVPRGVPGGFWGSIKGLKMLLRVTFLLLLLSALVFFGGLLFPGIQVFQPLQKFSLLCLALSGVVNGCAAMYGLRAAHGRFGTFLVENSWFVCFQCGYLLEGLPPCHRCPECGQPYHRSELEVAWRSWMSKNIVYSADERLFAVDAELGKSEDQEKLRKENQTP